MSFGFCEGRCIFGLKSVFSGSRIFALSTGRTRIGSILEGEGASSVAWGDIIGRGASNLRRFGSMEGDADAAAGKVNDTDEELGIDGVDGGEEDGEVLVMGGDFFTKNTVDGGELSFVGA